MAALLALLLLVLLTPTQSLRSLSTTDYKRGWQPGEGTYYGSTEAGNCAIRQPRPPMYANLQPVALNAVQYGDSSACGACIEFQGTGPGSGGTPVGPKRMGYIMDKCPECAEGDIDISKSGDGRWKVMWRFVPCPGNSLSLLFEGSNYWYWKIQPRGLRTPAKMMTVNGIVGKRMDDNFFVFNSGGFNTPVPLVITTVTGERITAKVTKWVTDGVVYVSAQSSSGGGGGGGGDAGGSTKPPPRTTTATPPRDTRPPSSGSSGERKRYWRPPKVNCTPRWKACTGPNNQWNTSLCCGPFHCVDTNAPGFVGKRCEPIMPDLPNGQQRCTPKWMACTGPKNYWRTRTCCGGYACVPPTDRNFIGKRCEPPKGR